MSYVKNYRKSKLAKNPDIQQLVMSILGMESGERLRVKVGSEKEMKYMRYALYSILPSILKSQGRKEDYQIKAEKWKEEYYLIISETIRPTGGLLEIAKER